MKKSLLLKYALSLIAAMIFVTGCASIPTSSAIFAGGGEVVVGGSVGLVAQGPTYGQGPEEVMRGFLLAAQAGPTASAPFMLAKEYLTPEAARAWLPMAGALVLDSVAALEITGDEEQPDVVYATAFGRAIAEVNANGEYLEFPAPTPVSLNFTLIRSDGNWRIAQLDDGVLVPDQVFTAAYRYTRIYRPSADLHSWVPEVRWFPQATWRTNAVQALFADPPAWLADAVLPAAPENLALELEDVEQTADGTYQVRVRGRIREADAETRVLLRAQIAAALLDDPGNKNVLLIDSNGLIPVPYAQLPVVARSMGAAVALADGQLWQVRGRELIALPQEIAKVPATPTALAVGYDFNQTIVWRDAHTAILSSGPDFSHGPERVALFEGDSVIAPSIDIYRFIWTGEQYGGLTAINPNGDQFSISANWLDGKRIEHIRVAPDGARIAIVTRDIDGTHLLVAGVIRDGQTIPIGLSQPLEVGASLHNISAVAWHDGAVLAVIGSTAGVRGVYLVGVGGLDARGGLPRHIPGISDPRWLTASVGSGNMLGIDAESKLHLREAMSLWPVVGQRVDLVAYPG